MAKDVSPPFVFVLPHPHTELPLSDESARVYHNHVIMVECSEGLDFSAIVALQDSDLSPSIVASDSGPDIWQCFLDKGWFSPQIRILVCRP